MMFRRHETPTRSNSPSTTPGSGTTTGTATEHLSTPATSQLDGHSTPDLVDNSKDDEFPPETTRRGGRRVTRSSLNNTTRNCQGEDEGQLLTELDCSGLNKDSDGPEPLEAGKRTLRSRRSEAMGFTVHDASHSQEVADNGPIHGQDETTPWVEITVPSDSPRKNQHSEKTADAATTQPDKEGKGRKRRVEADNEKATRRSTRISFLEKAKEVIGKTSSVLGKRPRDAKAEEKAVSRRQTLRPRNVTQAPTQTTASGEPPSKKPRLSGSAASTSKTAAPGPTAEKPKPVPYKKKCWLSHGLYAGKNTYHIDPTLASGTTKPKKGRNASGATRKLLPLPMYSGAKLLETGRDFKLPFDIFSPLPPGQPKPDEWRKTNRNRFVGDAASIWKAIKLPEMSTCTCTPETGCGEDCQNRFMFYECDDTNCKLGVELCGNRSFNGLRQRCKAGSKFDIGVEVMKTEDRGYGVRSNRSFEPNQIIVEYAGEIITQEECKRRVRTLYKNNECYYLMYFDQNMIIDATRGSIARFVNHSCEPNCKMEKWTVAGKPRMALFAGEDGIMTGEELTYDYNFDPYSQKNVQECRCGAPTCRGILGPRGKDAKEKQKIVPKPKRKSTSTATKIKSTGTKRQAESILDDSTSRLNKKRKITKFRTASLRAGLKKTVSKTVQSSKTARAPNKNQKADSTSSKTASTARKGNAKLQQSEKEKAEKGSKRPASTLAGGLSSPSRLRMSAGPRLGNSIAGGCKSRRKTVLQEKELFRERSKAGKSSDDKGVIQTRQTRARAKR